MDNVTRLVAYVQAHPLAAIGVAVAVVAVLYLLGRKPRAVRDAEARVAELRKDRHDHYRQQRPLNR